MSFWFMILWYGVVQLMTYLGFFFVRFFLCCCFFFFFWDFRKKRKVRRILCIYEVESLFFWFAGHIVRSRRKSDAYFKSTANKHLSSVLSSIEKKEIPPFRHWKLNFNGSKIIGYLFLCYFISIFYYLVYFFKVLSFHHPHKKEEQLTWWGILYCLLNNKGYK